MIPRWLHRTFLALLACSLVKYVWLAAYAHPVADDFCYAAKSRGMGLWAWSMGEWMTWNGRYASNLLMVHGPLTWWNDPLIGYRLVPVLLLALTFLSAWFLLRRLTREFLSSAEALLAALVFLLLYLNLMPDLGEGFYWYTGAITYQLGNILLLLHLGLLVPGGRKGLHRYAALAVNLLLAVAITGMDEIHMLLMVGLHTVRTVWLALGRKPVIPGLLLLLLTMAGAALMYAAPGNAVRGAMFAGTHRLGYSLGMSALQSVRFMGSWLLSPALLVFGLLYIQVHRQLADRVPGYRKLLRLPPWIAALLPLAVVAATIFPAYWNTGLLGQHRTINVACILFIPLAFLNLAIWLERGAFRNMATWAAPPRASAYGMALAIAALNLTGNGYAVHADLLGGRAAAYDRVMAKREAELRVAASDPSAKVVFIHQSNPPRTLPSYEGKYRLRDWMMHCQARYFGAEEDQVELDGH
ncbi:MAG TPA: hypothetical protein PLV70_09975 [Flavobacteriales bacterium]|nr:hypothetical protein [Flavobacteriales bacterium]HRP82066.1 hypothetical protein [Flavobacteriales bacterium]HRQ85427.1 hypothetical protein [Flavobacteriales bacterium]